MYSSHIRVISDVMCSPLPDIEHTQSNASLTTDNHVYSDVISYECLEGFRLISGSSQRLCGIDKQWDGQPLECEGTSIWCSFEVT